MGITLNDIVALAKLGYNPGDIKELISLSEKADAEKPEEQQKAAGAIDEPKPADSEAKEPTENVKPANAEQKDDVDYKKLYEQSQSDLKKAQEANIKKDSAPAQPEDPTKDLLDLVGSYL